MAIDPEVLGRSIKVVQYFNHRALDSALAEAGTSLAQWDALRAIARQPGSSAHWIAGETFQSDQAFGTLANRMEERGLIERSPGTGRAIAHHLTGAGEHALREGRKIARHVTARRFESLTEEERATLLGLLEKLA